MCPLIDRARGQRLGTARGEGAPDCPLHRTAVLGRRRRPFTQIRIVIPFHAQNRVPLSLLIAHELGNGRGFGSPFVRRLHITTEAARVHIAARRRGGVNPDNLAAMIPLAAPIALAVFAVLAWRYETRSWRAYEATLSPAEKRQFRAFRRIHPSKWRAFIALQQAERVARTRP